MTKKQNKTVEEVSSLIRKDFNVGIEEFADTFSLEELTKALTHAVKQLIDRDIERLVQALYRIDVSEGKVRMALATGSPDHIASSIAKLIIERELQKVESRQKYRK